MDTLWGCTNNTSWYVIHGTILGAGIVGITRAVQFPRPNIYDAQDYPKCLGATRIHGILPYDYS